MNELTPERWRRLAELLDEVADLPERERAEALAGVAAHEADLAAPLAEMLAADAAAGGFLERPLAVPAADPDDASKPAAEAGARIGPYRLLRELGRGGMGVVYLAERVEGGFEQRVALKLLKRGMDSEAIVARFARERQILARLVHPHIAALLDGGVATDGRPYFAMEHVEGEPITVSCDARRLGIPARVRLLADVCTAVQHAHANLVVHRDLKPGNVLVDGDGRVKLLDFGIAKLLTDEEDRTLSRLGGIPLTPAYAAPEQLAGGPITTATDVYALGAILYELLCGRRPHAPADSDSSPRTADGDAPPLAAALVRLPRGGEASAEAIAAQRGENLPALRRRLVGDLDAIVRKAMAGDPAARYRSAEAFAEDLQRHLGSQLVTARRPTVGYRAARFVKRHRVGVAAAALVLVAIVGGASAALWQARLAAREAARARAVSEFLVGIFEESDPDAAMAGRSTTALEVVERGAQRLDAELVGVPALRAELAGVLGDLYRKLGAYDRAAPLLEGALADCQVRYGENHVATASARERWGLLLWGRGDYAAAEEEIRHALAVRRGLLGSRHPEVAFTLDSLAAVVSDLGRHAEATELHRQALAIDIAAHGPESSEVATDWRNLGLALWKAEKPEEAEQALRHAVELRERVSGETHPKTLLARQALASFLSGEGRYAEAEPLFDALLPAMRARLGENHPTVAEAVGGAAVLKQRLGKLDEAAALFREEVAISRAVLGERHPEFATSLNNAATLAYVRGEWREAETGYREAIAIWTEALGRESENVASATGNLGMVLLREGELAAAEEKLRESLALRRKVFGPDSRDVVLGLKNLASALIERRALAEADALLAEAVPLAGKVYPADHPKVAETYAVLGALRLAQGQLAEARQTLERALVILAAKVDASDPRLALLHVDLGRASLGGNDPTQARAHLAAAVTTLRGRTGYARELARAENLLTGLDSPRR